MSRIIVLGVLKNSVPDIGLIDELIKEFSNVVEIEPISTMAYYTDHTIDMQGDKLVRGMSPTVAVVLNPSKVHLAVLNALLASNSNVTVFAGTSVDGVVKLSSTSLQALIEQINPPTETASNTAKLAHVVAMRPNGLIGLNNTLPWKHNKYDMRIFREHTLDRLVLMGYNTVDSLPKALTGRTVAMVTKDAGRQVKAGVLDKCDHWCSNGIESILNNQHFVMEDNDVVDRSMIMIAGGGKLYEETMSNVGVVYQSIIFPRTENDQDLESKGVYYPISELEDNFVRVSKSPICYETPESEGVQLNIWVRK